MPTNHNYRRARKTETPCRWCIYGLMRAGAGRVQCLLWGLAAKKGNSLRCGPGGDGEEQGLTPAPACGMVGASTITRALLLP